MDGASQWLGEKEINELPNILWDDETLEDVIQGTYNNGTGLLVATNIRVIFIDKGLLWGLKVEDFPYSKISSIQYNNGILLGEITIFASNNKAQIKNLQKKPCARFCEHVRAMISHKEESHQSKNSPNDSKDDLINKLERLASLKESGALTEDEYKKAKAKLL